MKTISRGIFLISAIAMSLSVQGQTQRSGGDSARFAQQLQQITMEKNKLLEEITSLKKENESLKEKTTQLNAEITKSRQQISQLEADANKLQSAAADKDSAIEKYKNQVQEVLERNKETAMLLKKTESDKESQIVALGVEKSKVMACTDNNQKLYLLSEELVNKLENQSLFSVLVEKERFIKLSKTRLENLVDEYKDRISELSLAKPN